MEVIMIYFYFPYSLAKRNRKTMNMTAGSTATELGAIKTHFRNVTKSGAAR
jgi:hypothetical protein